MSLFTSLKVQRRMVMKKYEALKRFLEKAGTDTVKLGFGQVERILGFPLPASARRYRAWWSNDETHVQAIDGWLSGDWRVDHVSIESESVVFKDMSREETGVSRSVTVKNSSFQAELARHADASKFEEFARYHMSKFFGRNLTPRKKPEWAKLFDLVSDDFSVVGDAKYLSMVRGKCLPPAKFSVIAEHVWMLEKTDASRKFLVFGNEQRVPEEWLRRYGRLVNSVLFFFLAEGGEIMPLNSVGDRSEVRGW